MRYKIFVIIVNGFILFSCLTASSNSDGRLATQPPPGNIWAADWSPSGKYIVAGGDDSILRVYQGPDYKLVDTYQANGGILGLAWHPNDDLLAIASSRGVQLLDIKIRKLQTLPGLPRGGRGIGWNHTGELLALADGSGLVQILSRRGELLRSISKHNRNSYFSLDWHPQKDILVTSSDEIILFDTSGHQLNLIRHRKEETGVLSVRWHPSGKFFASGDYGHEQEGVPTLLQFWKEDGTLIKTIKGHQKEIRNIRWSSDGNSVATAADALRIWTMNGELAATGASSVNLWGLAWSRDDKQIVTGSFEGGQLRLWDNYARMIKLIDAATDLEKTAGN